MSNNDLHHKDYFDNVYPRPQVCSAETAALSSEIDTEGIIDVCEALIDIIDDCPATVKAVWHVKEYVAAKNIIDQLRKD